MWLDIGDRRRVRPARPRPSRRPRCGGGPTERRPEPRGRAGAPATPTPGTPSWPPPGPRSPSAGSTARRSAASRPTPGSTRRSCTTTSAARTSCSSPPSRRRPTRPSCCPRCSPPTADELGAAVVRHAAAGLGRPDAGRPAWRCCAPPSSNEWTAKLLREFLVLEVLRRVVEHAGLRPRRARGPRLAGRLPAHRRW